MKLKGNSICLFVFKPTKKNHTNVIIKKKKKKNVLRNVLNKLEFNFYYFSFDRKVKKANFFLLLFFFYVLFLDGPRRWY